MVLSVGSFDHVDKQIDSGGSESLEGLAHRGQCNRSEGRQRHIVGADHRHIFGYTSASVNQSAQNPESHVVARREDSRYLLHPSQQGPEPPAGLGTPVTDEHRRLGTPVFGQRRRPARLTARRVGPSAGSGNVPYGVVPKFQQVLRG